MLDGIWVRIFNPALPHALAVQSTLKTIRYRRGYAFTCASQGWEFNPQDF